MRLPRALTATISEKLQISSKGIILYGPRQAGKTTLITDVISRLGLKTLTINGDQSRYIDVITSRNVDKIRGLLEGYELLFVDEAQRIAEIGINLKIVLDNLPTKVIATGSSSLDLASKVSEPLTGRVWTYRLYPMSFLELSDLNNREELDVHLEERMVYGSYPEIFSYPGDVQKREYLQNLADSYLYKDLLEFGNLRNSAKIRDLLKLLAFQVGSLVSISELGSNLGMGKDTVNHYIDLLEKSFVVFRLHGFNRNLRKEIAKMGKIYFYDLGVRNILIDNLKSLKDRNDPGQLWENFLIVERMKYLAYTHHSASTYFWRTHTGSELDYIEEEGGHLYGYEFKLGAKTATTPLGWHTAYPKAEFMNINRQNYFSFIADK